MKPGESVSLSPAGSDAAAFEQTAPGQKAPHETLSEAKLVSPQAAKQYYAKSTGWNKTVRFADAFQAVLHSGLSQSAGTAHPGPKHGWRKVPNL